VFDVFWEVEVGFLFVVQIESLKQFLDDRFFEDEAAFIEYLIEVCVEFFGAAWVLPRVDVLKDCLCAALAEYVL
jgi:hypothetical protein